MKKKKRLSGIERRWFVNNVGVIMLLVPGIPFTNAIRDSMHGDMVSGGARICDAVMRAVILATGAGIAMLAFLRIGGGIAWWM